MIIQQGLGNCILDVDGGILCDDVMTGPTPTPQQIGAGMPNATPTFAQWIQANSTAVYAGAAALVAMAVLRGRR